MNRFHQRSLLFLRISLGIFFLWTGVLKLFVSSPSLVLLQRSLPQEIGFSQVFTFVVAFIEILIGVSYLSNKLDRIASIAMIISMVVVSILVFVTQGFDPRFPVLSLAGELVLKNLILISAGWVLLYEQGNTSKTFTKTSENPLK